MGIYAGNSEACAGEISVKEIILRLGGTYGRTGGGTACAGGLNPWRRGEQGKGFVALYEQVQNTV